MPNFYFKKVKVAVITDKNDENEHLGKQKASPHATFPTQFILSVCEKYSCNLDISNLQSSAVKQWGYSGKIN